MEKIVDIRDENILKRVVGKKLESIYCEELLVRKEDDITKCISFEAKLIISGYIYNITAYEKDEYDYFGANEEVAIFELAAEPYSEEEVMKYGGIKTEINTRIKSIKIVNEHQKLFKSVEETYEVKITRGVILYFDDFEIALEKSEWFTDYLHIDIGNNLIERFPNPKTFVEEWEEWGKDKGVKAECEREIIILDKPVE